MDVRDDLACRLRQALSGLLDERGRLHPLLKRHRLAAFVLLSCVLSAASFTTAFLIRFELSNIDRHAIVWHAWLWRTLPLVLAVRLAVSLALGLHRVTWRFASAKDVIPVVAATFVSTLLLVPGVLLVWNGHFPRGVLAIDAMAWFILLAASRYSCRLGEEILTSLGAGRRTRAIVVGAGAAGDLTVRAMHSRMLADYWPVAILDDDPYKQGTTIQGVPVLTGVDRVLEAARRTRASAIVLAVPSASTSSLYRIVRLCRDTGLPLKTIPDLGQILRSSNVVTRVSDFRLEDLLVRRPIRHDVPEIRRFLAGRTVLVTGAAGSIGSELCRQIAEQDVSCLVCLDRDENGLFRLEHALRALPGCGDTEIVPFLGDIRDRGRMERLFRESRPEVVFHAAAYKHVPMLQHHPVEAVRNNVGGTRILSELADVHGVETFVLISTDKAVNPTSVMGATKRIAERIVRSRNLRSATRFCNIRFGNVLGSNGSVVELFLRQIRRGAPLTVTHPEIERYFMTIPEAVHLVLYSATMGRGGETFILDMGRPVKIDQLARQMIQLSGLTPDVDVPIVYTGLRPGEKLYEELWTELERPAPTRHPGILAAPTSEAPPERLDSEVVRLLNCAADNDLDGVWAGILALVPTFQGRTNGSAVIPPDRTVA